jgi:ATP phosphoribosyltransferase
LKDFIKKYKLSKNILSDLTAIKNLSKISYKTIFSTNFGRDIEYYTGMVFEIYNSSKKEIARGGRYDGLLKSLGSKKNISAVGAAINLNNLKNERFNYYRVAKQRKIKEGSINFFEKNNFKLTSNGGERNYFAQIEKLPNTKVIYLHAKEIIQRLGDGTLDMGISGLDLLRESTINLQKKIEVKKKLDFGTANVVVAIPNDWIDVQTVADLEEVSFDFRDKKNIRLRVATKYPNLTNNFLVSKESPNISLCQVLVPQKHILLLDHQRLSPI